MITFFFNCTPLYRKKIYTLISEEFPNCEIYSSDVNEIECFDASVLKTYKGSIRTYRVGNVLLRPSLFRFAFSLNKLVISAEYYCIVTWILLFISFFSGKKIYLWGHGFYGKESKIILFVKRMFFSLAEGVFVYNQRSMRIMNSLSIENVFVIYNSLDYDKSLECRDKLVAINNPYNQDFKNVIFIGRLIKSKCLDMLIDLAVKIPHISISFIGSGPEFKYLKNKVVSLDVDDRVFFLGAVYDEAIIAKYLFFADLCVSPGNIGLTAIHSLTFGCPVVTSNDFCNQGPEHEAILDSGCGGFYRDKDLTSLIEEVTRILSFSDNEKTLLRVKAYKIIDEFYNPYYQVNLLKKVLDEHCN